MKINHLTSPRKASHKTIFCTVALSATLAISPLTAFADTAAEKQAEADSTYETLVAMQKELDEASANYSDALAELEQAQQRMEECQDQIDQKTAEIEDYQDKLATRARSMYRSGGNAFMDVVLDSATFEEFASNMDILIEMNNRDANLVQQSKDAKETLETAKTEYAEQESIAQEKTDETERIKNEAEATVTEIQDLYDSLSEEAEKLLEEERKAAEEAAASQAESVVEESAANGGEYQQSEENLAYQEQLSEDGTSVESESSESESASESSTSSDTSVTYGGGSDAVSRAQACLGAPYSWGACGPDSFDCSGLVSYCLTGSYTRLGTTSTFMGWTQVSDPQPGDVCTSSYHCGIYIGNGQMIHAADYGIGVIVGPVQSDMIIVRW